MINDKFNLYKIIITILIINIIFIYKINNFLNNCLFIKNK